MSTYGMSKSTDERGRLYLPKEVRERFGDRFRIVELPSHVALFPVDKDPVDGLRSAVGDAFEGMDTDELKAHARKAVSREVAEGAGGRTEESDE
jgi:bifunctional DNA-binding transcriptional regulator/antitoxin component of YhaV-PrlF toxin-antitoxin module